MAHEAEQVTLLNKEVEKSFWSIVFPTQPKNLKSVLALAREAEANIKRSMFSTLYAKENIAERKQAKEEYKSRS